MTKTVAVLVVALALCGCGPPAPDMRATNPEKYDRDASFCREQVDATMKTRRRVDTSSRDVFRGDRDRYGQGALPEQMDAYSDSKSSDRVMSDCMESRGWQSASGQGWWKKIGQPHTF
jgi:hypothetical protein